MAVSFRSHQCSSNAAGTFGFDRDLHSKCDGCGRAIARPDIYVLMNSGNDQEMKIKGRGSNREFPTYVAGRKRELVTVP